MASIPANLRPVQASRKRAIPRQRQRAYEGPMTPTARPRYVKRGQPTSPGYYVASLKTPSGDNQYKDREVVRVSKDLTRVYMTGDEQYWDPDSFIFIRKIQL